MAQPEPPFLLSDVIYAACQGAGESLRKWLKARLIELDANVGEGWARFTYRDLVRLALIRRLVDVGLSVREANELLRLWIRWISYPFDSEPDGAGDAFNNVKMIVRRNEDGTWSVTTGEEDYINERMKTDVLILLDLGSIIGTTFERARESLDLRREEKEVLKKARAQARKQVEKLRMQRAAKKPKPRKSGAEERPRG
jgi:MerR HTH family regulatory protein